MIDIKIEILAKYEDVRGIDVNYYTDPLLQAQKPIWETELRCYKERYPHAPDGEAWNWVQRSYPAGVIRHITFYDDKIPEGDELWLFLLRQAPTEILIHKEKILNKQFNYDMSHIVVGAEVSMRKEQVKQILNQELVVKTIGI